MVVSPSVAAMVECLKSHFKTFYFVSPLFSPIKQLVGFMLIALVGEGVGGLGK